MKFIDGATDFIVNPSCVTCIMNRYVWCSAAWTFEAAAAYTFPTSSAAQGATNDLGQCCFGTFTE